MVCFLGICGPSWPTTWLRSECATAPEFVAETVRKWIKAVGARTAYIEPDLPWENGYIESFSARFRDELLNREIFYSLGEVQSLIEQWRPHRAMAEALQYQAAIFGSWLSTNGSGEHHPDRPTRSTHLFPIIGRGSGTAEWSR